MLELLTVLLLSAAAVLLNTYAKDMADRSSARRVQLEEGWSAMIAAAAGEVRG